MNNRKIDANHLVTECYGHLAQNTLLFVHHRVVREFVDASTVRE